MHRNDLRHLSKLSGIQVARHRKHACSRDVHAAETCSAVMQRLWPSSALLMQVLCTLQLGSSAAQSHAV